MERPRILLADDHRIVAEGLGNLLASDFELVDVVEDGQALLDSVEALRPDVVVADISMPVMNGIDALTELKRRDPDVRVVMLTMHRDVNYARRALAAGALGYVLKHSAAGELVDAITAALEGRIWVSPRLIGDLAEAGAGSGSGETDPVASLTKRQREILELLTEGRSAKEIGDILSISRRTVEFHKYQMMETLQVHTSAELITFAIRHGIAPL